MFPHFNEFGDVPVGVYQSTLSEFIDQFGTNSAARRILASRLARIFKIASETRLLRRFVVFGSFVTSKPEPNDVDVFMIMNDNFDVGVLVGESELLFDHLQAEVHFGCSVFWVRAMAALGGEQAAIEDWQIKRDGTRRGIVEITGE